MTCADCNRTTVVMLEMKPGADKKTWALCSACWLASVRKPIATVVVDAKKLHPSDQQMLGVGD